MSHPASDHQVSGEPNGSIHHSPRDAKRARKAEAAASKAHYKASRPWYRKPLALLGAALAGILVFAVAASCLSSNSGQTGSGSGAVVEQPATQPAPAEDLTTSQENAIQQAEMYIDSGGGLSRDGLVRQLTVAGGFPEEDAVFAVDRLDVDWNEQAAIHAEQYQVAQVGLSRDAMIRQLTVAALFTEEQAQYGADSVGLSEG